MFFMVRRGGLKNLILDTLRCLDPRTHCTFRENSMFYNALEFEYHVSFRHHSTPRGEYFYVFIKKEKKEKKCRGHRGISIVIQSSYNCLRIIKMIGR